MSWIGRSRALPQSPGTEAEVGVAATAGAASASLALESLGSQSVPRLPHGDRSSDLTPSEQATVNALAQGLAPKQIAREYHRSLSTVRTLIASAKRKTGARTVTELVAKKAVHVDGTGRAASVGQRDNGRRSRLLVEALPEARLRRLHDEYDLSGFLAQSPKQTVYLRRAARAFEDLTELFGASPSVAVVRGQVAAGLESSLDFEQYLEDRDPVVLLSGTDLEDLALALAGTIIAAYRASELGISMTDARDDVVGRLTSRQLQVVLLLAHGHRYREIGEALSMSERQARRHTVNAIARLGVRNANELVALVSLGAPAP